MIIPAVVGAAVAASVAGNVATKVVDKLFSHFATPFNMHIRDSLLHRGIVKESDLPR